MRLFREDCTSEVDSQVRWNRASLGTSGRHVQLAIRPSQSDTNISRARGRDVNRKVERWVDSGSEKEPGLTRSRWCRCVVRSANVSVDGCRRENDRGGDGSHHHPPRPACICRNCSDLQRLPFDSPTHMPRELGMNGAFRSDCIPWHVQAPGSGFRRRACYRGC